jgi:hypothetical protein
MFKGWFDESRGQVSAHVLAEQGRRSMRIERRMYGGLALMSCLGFGAALGVWFFALAGDHLFVVPRAVELASLLVGMLCLWVGMFSLFMLVRGPR